MFKINNRRYIGSKTKLLPFIEESISKYIDIKKGVFVDLFAGTGVVSEYFLKKGFDSIINDNLFSNYVIYNCFFSNESFNPNKIKDLIGKFNNLKANSLENNYFSDVYAGKYYSIDNSKLIGYIRDEIEKKYLTKLINLREKYILITSLIYSADKIANTVGHFEHYLKTTPPTSKEITLQIPEIINFSSQKIKIYNEDANTLSKKIESDICYIDPPYNARQYVNFYHVLENLARWNKPTEFEGISMKFKRNELKSGYSKKRAPYLFQDLINSINSKWILVSYNNTYSAGSSASNNTIKLKEIKEILEKKGDLNVEETNYKHFNSGKTNFLNHKEVLFICKVRK